MTAVIFWLHSQNFTTTTIINDTFTCQEWVDHVLTMGWSAWAFCI